MNLVTSFVTPPDLTSTQTLSGNDTGTVASGSFVTVNTARAVALDLLSAPTVPGGIVLVNSGTISSTLANARAIDTTTVPSAARTMSITNNANATITSQNDAIRISTDLTTGSAITLDNFGTISTTGTGSNSGQALDFNAITTPGSTVSITNRAGATISAADADAVRPGQGGNVQNYGTIRSDVLYPGTIPAGYQPSNDGVDFQDNHTGSVHNYGTGIITGAKGGVAGGTNSVVTVTNDAGGQIVGRNGAGVGLDGSGTVVNNGLIRGTFDGTSTRADGDGVDIDFTATVTNFGIIEALGARGNDSGGRTNAAEGVSIGGGTIANHGTIRTAAGDGAGGAIVVNNDANADRSGNAATSITNYAAASIVGGGSFAVRLENKANAAISADALTNYGTITGNGTIPDPTAVVTFMPTSGNNAGRTIADPNSIGTLDGQTYTGTGSARFVRGDGAAIQMGEGDDVLNNYGTITGNTTRALNLEGGSDTLNLFTGSTITGRIDGGAGTDTLNLRQDDRAATNVGDVGANSGATSGTLANVINFETLNVAGGTWTIGDQQTYSAGTTVAAGAALRVNGTLTSAVTVSGTLTGGGSAGAVTVQSGGTLSAGNTLGTLGTGNLSLAAGSTLSADITGRTAGLGYDQINVTGSVSLAGAALTLNFGGFTSAAGDTFVIVNNDGVDAITGAGGAGTPSLTYGGGTLTEGSTFSANARTYRLSYQGGTNSNDVTLTDVTAAPPPADPGPTVTPNPQGGNTITTNDPAQITADLGTAGVDQVNYAGSAPLVLPANIENVVLTGTADSLMTGNALSNIITGNAGSNTVAGGIGNDTVAGGEGTDLIYGNQDADLIYGNQGADVLYGGQGDDRAFGGQGADRLFGNLGNDVLSGNVGDDIVYGNQGVDIVYGNQGADILFGGQGDDILYGGQGDDVLVGGIGNNTLMGGIGADRYVFGSNPGARDIILGFNQAEGDRLSFGGQTYTVGTAQNGDALLMLSGGGTVDLAGMRADQVSASYFAT